MSLYRSLRRGAAVCALGLLSCQSAGPVLAPLGSAEVRVNETLQLDLEVDNPEGLSLDWSFVGPDLPGLPSVARVTGSPAGGSFVWTPLASHVGDHELTIQIDSPRGGASEALRVTVAPATDAAPVFVRPGPGGTFDLEQAPCIEVEVEVRDDDSAAVDLWTVGELPEGATFDQWAEKAGTLSWCPSPAQLDTSERWSFQFSADDGDHEPVVATYVAVLRTQARDDCPGAAPVVEIVSPEKGEEVTASSSFEVVVSVEDDLGLRDPPLLYFTTEEPADEENPDLGRFELRTMEADGGNWTTRIPNELASGEEQLFYLVASATDNDDPTGAACDHRTDSDVHPFVGIGGGGGGGGLANCEACAASSDCASGVCALGPVGPRCVSPCSPAVGCSSGSCELVAMVEGASVNACGPVGDVCGGGSGPCTNDPFEPNDERLSAVSVSGSVDATICDGEADWWSLPVRPARDIEVVLDGFSHASGDLDLLLTDAAGTTVGQSAGVTDVESVTWCSGEGGPLYARVVGYAGASNDYQLSWTEGSATCCTNDRSEPDNSAADARMVDPLELWDGTICPEDEDWVTFYVGASSQIDVFLAILSSDADLDMALYRPSGALAGQSEGITDEERIVVAGTEIGWYTLRVFGYLADSGDYVGEVTLTPL